MCNDRCSWLPNLVLLVHRDWAALPADLLANFDDGRNMLTPPAVRMWQVQVAQRGITARKVASQLLAALRRGGSVLGGVLPPAAHVTVASSLLQSTVSAIIGARTPTMLTRVLQTSTAPLDVWRRARGQRRM